MLRLSSGALASIEIANHYQPNVCLREVILMWLQGSSYSHSPPTWKRVVEVVGSPAGGDNPVLARRIASQHPKGVLLGSCIDTWVCDTISRYGTSFSSISSIKSMFKGYVYCTSLIPRSFTLPVFDNWSVEDLGTRLYHSISGQNKLHKR